VHQNGVTGKAGSRLDLVRSERLSAADAALTFPALRQGSDDYNAKASQCSISRVAEAPRQRWRRTG
jgi:hypothetical protein